MSELRTQDLEVRYGAERAVHELSLEVRSGQSLSLLGPNSAGKSSALSAVTGMVRPSSGRVEIDHVEASGRDSRWFIDRGVVLVPEGQRNFAAMSVMENLELPLRVLGLGRSSRVVDDVFTLFPVLAERRHQAAGLLSGGEQKMLAIGRGLMTRPTVICVDEPTLGLAPVVISNIAEALRALQDRGVATLVSEQNLRFVQELGGEVVVLERGVVRWRGPSDALDDQAAAQEALMGAGTRNSGRKPR